MPIRKRLVQENLSWLTPLHSYLKVGHVWEHHATGNPLDKYQDFISSEVAVGVTETVFGIYVNSGEDLDFLVVTDSGIRGISRGQATFLSYDSIDSISVPTDEDRDLDIMLKTGECISLAILSCTDEVPDIHAFYEFLSSLLPFRHQSLIEVKKIDSRRDLVRYIKEHHLDELAYSVETGLLEKSLKELNIDPSIFQHPDIWRLVAVLVIDRPWAPELDED